MQQRAFLDVHGADYLVRAELEGQGPALKDGHNTVIEIHAAPEGDGVVYVPEDGASIVIAVHIVVVAASDVVVPQDGIHVVVEYMPYS